MSGKISQQIRDYFEFWLWTAKRCLQKSIEPFEKFGSICAIIAGAVAVAFLVHWITQEWGDYIIYWTLAVPFGVWVIALLWHFTRLPHEYYKYQNVTRFLFSVLIVGVFTGLLTIKKSLSIIAPIVSTSQPASAGQSSQPITPSHAFSSDRTYEMTIPVFARPSEWQSNLDDPLILKTGEVAYVRTSPMTETNAGIWYVDTPLGPNGAGGLAPITNNNGHFMDPNAPNGALLMKVGDGRITNWTKDAETKIVDTPGIISFIANDDMTYRDGKPTAYDDNFGSLLLYITVSNTTAP